MQSNCGEKVDLSDDALASARQKQALAALSRGCVTV